MMTMKGLFPRSCDFVCDEPEFHLKGGFANDKRESQDLM